MTPFTRPPSLVTDRVGRAFAVVLGAIAVVIGLGPAVALADAAGPTDYLTEVVDITPHVAGISARIIGGDSFIELVVDPGIDVVVLGYEGEPYLWFTPAGEVLENQLSPSRFLNGNRYGAATVPPEADAEADPQWLAIGAGGTWAWHDHRTHWMSNVPPLGLHPGDQILDDAVPLVVDGVDVQVRVVSHWLPEPSRVPVALGFAVGLALSAGCVRRRHRPALVSTCVALAGVAALVVGVWQTRSLPPETGPPITAWALPAVATVLATMAMVPSWSGFARASLVIVASVQLLVWFVVRRATLSSAVLPTAAPFWLDRAVTAATAVVALAGLVLGVLAVQSEGRGLVSRPVPAPR